MQRRSSGLPVAGRPEGLRYRRVLPHLHRRDHVTPVAVQIAFVVVDVARLAVEIAIFPDPHARAEHADRRDPIVEAARQRYVGGAARDAEVAPVEVAVLVEAGAFARDRLVAPDRQAPGVPGAVAVT